MGDAVSVVVETGMIVAGFRIPGTDWCLRDADAWWSPGERGTRKRAEVRDLLVGHWTGGESGVARYDDDGPFVVRAAKARKNEDGEPLNVGFDFVIGACDPACHFAHVWQTADIGLTATVHVGVAEANARGIAVEVVSCGLAKGMHSKRPRPTITRRVRGGRIVAAGFFPGQLRSWVRLAEALSDPKCEELRAAGIKIPRVVPTTTGGKPLTDVRAMTRPELRRYAGATEHALMPGTTKLDAGGMLVAELAARGWDEQPLAG